MNEPGYVAHVAEFIATLKDESLRDVARQTTDNFFNLFKVPGN
jgi:TatD DNase family protein